MNAEVFRINLHAPTGVCTAIYKKENTMTDYSLSLNYLAFSHSAFRNPSSPGLFSPAVNASARTDTELSGLPGAEKPKDGERIPGRPDTDTYECQTCKNRKYQDGSNDPNVSFKSPTRLSPERAAFAIRAHEAEHVSHAWAQAQKEDKEILSQSVTYHTAICPECGRTYMSGGTTRTVFRSKPQTDTPPVQKGRYLDVTA